jgi:hypothetical protein
LGCLQFTLKGEAILVETRTIQTRRVLIAAGRRVDAYGDVARFPSARVPAVQQQIQEFLAREKPLAVVCSAACGADLLILEAAGEQHIDRLIVLPSQPEQFRKMSVTDRPGNWGDVFDRVIRPSKVEVLSGPDGQQGYLQTNLKLVERGQAVAREHSAALQALVVWDKKERGPGDVTAHFLRLAKQHNIPVVELDTLGPANRNESAASRS